MTNRGTLGGSATDSLQALVSAFIDELFRRVQKQGFQLYANTHRVTLHLDGETGPVLDTEDLLGDLVTEPKNEILFAVFRSKSASAAPGAPVGAQSVSFADRRDNPGRC